MLSPRNLQEVVPPLVQGMAPVKRHLDLGLRDWLVGLLKCVLASEDNMGEDEKLHTAFLRLNRPTQPGYKSRHRCVI